MTALLSLVLVSLSASPVYSNNAASATVSAVLHEGVVSFVVDHPAVVAMQVKIYELESDRMVFDSGPRRGTSVKWSVDTEVDGAWRYLVSAWDREGSLVLSQSAATTSADLISTVPFGSVPVNTRFVAADSAIGLEGDVVFGPGDGHAEIQEFSGYGGRFDVYDDAGNTASYLQADTSGSGGYLAIARSTTTIGFKVDGNSSGTYAPEVVISGPARSAVFDMAASGDDAVALPVDAVSSDELIDEPGVASVARTSDLVVPENTIATVLQRTMTLPTAGYVIAICSGVAYRQHDYNTWSNGASWGINVDSQSMPLFSHWYLPPTAGPTGIYYFSLATVRVLRGLSAGDHTFYLILSASSAETTASSAYMQLLFVPTAYGINAEDPGKAGTEGAASGQDERTLSIAANQARIEAELELMKARVDALQEKLRIEPE